MSRLVELHVAVSGAPIAVNPDNVCRIGEIADLSGKPMTTTFVRQVDGSSVDVKESYAQVKALLDGSAVGRMA
jgi:hypothetical protein